MPGQFWLRVSHLAAVRWLELKQQGSGEAEGLSLWCRLTTGWPQDKWTAHTVAAGFTIEPCFPTNKEKAALPFMI